MASYQDRVGLHIRGHLKISEYLSEQHYADRDGQIVLDRPNAIDRENASVLFARSLTHRDLGNFYYMAFGNGGAVVNSVGSLDFNPPNVVGISADLYSPLFNISVDDAAGSPTGYMRYTHTNGTNYSDAIIHAIIGKNEPLALLQGSTAVTINELGLKLSDDTLITHVTFSPLQKRASAIMEIVYTLRITVEGTAE